MAHFFKKNTFFLHGLTVIELTIAASLIALLAGFIIVTINPDRTISNSDANRALVNMSRIANALSRCLEDTNYAYVTCLGTNTQCPPDGTSNNTHYVIGNFTGVDSGGRCTYPSQYLVTRGGSFENGGVVDVCSLVSNNYLREVPIDPEFGWVAQGGSREVGDPFNPTPGVTLARASSFNCSPSGADYYSGYALYTVGGIAGGFAGRNFIEVYSLHLKDENDLPYAIKAF